MLAPVSADWSSGGRLPGIRPEMGRVSGEDITVAVMVRAVVAALVLTGKPFAAVDDDDDDGRRPSVVGTPPLLTEDDALLLVTMDDEDDGGGCGGVIVMVDSLGVDFPIIGMMIFCGTVTVRMTAVQASAGSWFESSSSR